MKTKTSIILICVSLILLPIITIIFFWNSIKCSFFTFSLMDILNVISTILIGIVVTYYFSYTFSNSAKRLEIIVENLNSFQDYYVNIITTISNLNKKKISRELKQHLLRLFKFASNESYNLKKYLLIEIDDKEFLNKNFSEIDEEHITLKEIITDAPFEINQITENDIKYSTEHFYIIKQKIQQIKLHLYK